METFACPLGVRVNRIPLCLNLTDTNFHRIVRHNKQKQTKVMKSVRFRLNNHTFVSFHPLTLKP